MLQLLGREPDFAHRQGSDGIYWFQYEPKTKAEEVRFSEAAGTLQGWLSIFDILPLHSTCAYGYLPHPQRGQEGKKYLDICIAHEVQKKEVGS